LDYFGARYYSSFQGRFTSPDPLSFWMLGRKKQDLYIANPQRWNKYAYVINNPLRYVDPDGLAEIPTWDKLNKELRDDLAKRLGKDAQKIWNGWSNDQRQHVLNVRAVLMDKGVWKDVREITYGRVDVKDEWGARNTVTFTPDNSQSSWQLGILSDKNMEWVLKEAGFEGESANWNHEEGRYTMKQPGDDVVLHMVLLDKPADAFSVPHFDSGGGSIVNREHFKEWLSGKGLTHDKITTALGRTSAVQYLRGISDSMDKLLVQPKR
jgi:RHS repeat-associated protein